MKKKRILSQNNLCFIRKVLETRSSACDFNIAKHRNRKFFYSEIICDVISDCVLTMGENSACNVRPPPMAHQRITYLSGQRSCKKSNVDAKRSPCSCRCRLDKLAEKLCRSSRHPSCHQYRVSWDSNPGLYECKSF